MGRFETNWGARIVIGTILIIGAIGWTDATEVSSDQFKRLIGALHEPVRDLGLVYEGEARWIGSPQAYGGDPEQFTEIFQGSYLYRHDGAEYMDVYVKQPNEVSLVHHIRRTHLRGIVESAVITPDTARKRSGSRNARSGPGGPGSLSGPQSLHPLMYHWYFRSIGDPREWGYVCTGWEDVDQRRCLKIRMNTLPNTVPDKNNYKIFWIDLERGGHPLKTEHINNGKLISRVSEVSLESLRSQGKTSFWLPVRCVLTGFEWSEKFYDDPVMKTVISVVGGSVVFNQDYPDSAFSVKRGGLPTAAEVKELRRSSTGLSLGSQFENQSLTSTRTDPEGVKARLDKMLNDADQQKARLEASSAAFDEETWSPHIRQILVFMGFSLLVGPLIWKWKYR